MIIFVHDYQMKAMDKEDIIAGNNLHIAVRPVWKWLLQEIS